jgi:hypothetical protein
MRSAATTAVIVAILAIAVAGCAAGTSTLLHDGSGHTSTNASPGVPAGSVRVIRGWADALRSGHVVAAARFFHVPSEFFLGSGPPLELHSLAEVEKVNAELPCGAKFVSAKLEGRFVNALFRLTDRTGPGSSGGCGSGVGETARTNFVIRNGHIVAWLRAPDEPGDNGTPKSSPSTPTSPGTTPGGGSVI